MDREVLVYVDLRGTPDLFGRTFVLFEFEQPIVIDNLFSARQCVERNAKLAASDCQNPGADFVDYTGTADAVATHEGCAAVWKNQTHGIVERVNHFDAT